VVVLELIGREMVALVDAGVVLGTEFVLDAVHLVLVSAKVPAALDPAVLTIEPTIAASPMSEPNPDQNA